MEHPCNEWGNTGARWVAGCRGPNDVTMGAQNNLQLQVRVAGVGVRSRSLKMVGRKSAGALHQEFKQELNLGESILGNYQYRAVIKIDQINIEQLSIIML